MSDPEVSSHCPSPAGTGSVHGEEYELTQIQEQDIQSPVRNTDANLLEDWKTGLHMEDRLEARENDFTEEERMEAWKAVDKAVKTYSDEMVERWIAEMDTLLVYAGLFSAVLTAFNVESYSLLSPTAPDPVIAALTQISAQLASFSVHDPFVNSTQPAFQQSIVPSNSTSQQRWAVWLNILWFSSLICSLSAAFVAIMVKQWIHEYKSGISGSSRNTSRLRQHRYNGLVKWKVAVIIAVLPILLQIASGLFLAGLLVLLWNLNHTVAIVASTLVGALLAFTLVTIILPTFTSNCAYLSPISISLFRSSRLTYGPIHRLIYIPIRMFIARRAYSVYQRASYGSILWRISHRLLIFPIHPLSPSFYAMQSAYVTEYPEDLDQDVFITAYSTTGDLSLLEQASTCFSDLSINDLSKFHTRIHAQNREYGQTASLDHWTHYIPLDMASDMLLVCACKTSGVFGETSGQNTSSLQERNRRYLRSSHAVLGDHRISCMLSNMAAVLYNDGNRHPDDFPVYFCLLALSKQMDSVEDTKSALTDDARRRVIAAIFTFLRTSTLDNLWANHDTCINILISCSSPSITRSPLGGRAEEDTRRKPLADAIALAEDALITTLRSPEFQNGDSERKCLTIDFFFRYYQRIGLEQLADRISERMLRALEGVVKDLPPAGRSVWPRQDLDEMWKDGLLEWLKSLEKERDKQIAAAG